MAKERILITVKTYPTLSSKYDELVCTAGFREDGSWVRIYPIPFRKLEYDSRYSKYQWIEIDLVKNTSDPRPESFRPYNYEKIIAHDVITTGKDRLWIERKKYVLKNVYTDLRKLIAEAKDKKICTSLATFKPTEILDFKIFDRYGGVLFDVQNFQPNDPIFGWNGRFGNAVAQNGHYIYQVVVEYIDGEIITKKGSVMLSR